jgi:adenylate cyclase
VEGAPVIRGTSRKLGLTMRYRELPYEWQSPRFVHAELFYDNGPLRYARLRGEYLEDQSAVHYRVDYVPRRRFSLAGLLARGILKKLTTIVRRIDAQLPETFSDPLAAEGFADRSPAAMRRAADLGRRWRDLAPDAVIADSVADFVATAPDRMVGRMRPYGLAQQLGTTRRETLQFCLRAANEGFLELSWDLVCPSCKGAKRRVADIADLGTRPTATSATSTTTRTSAATWRSPSARWRRSVASTMTSTASSRLPISGRSSRRSTSSLMPP